MSDSPANSPRAKRVEIRLKVSLKFTDRDSFAERFSQNISTRGMFIQAIDPPPIGSRVRFEYTLSNSVRVMRGLGIVRWQMLPDQAREQGLTPGMGIEFVDLDAGTERFVREVVKKHGEGANAPNVGKRYTADQAQKATPGAPSLVPATDSDPNPANRPSSNKSSVDELLKDIGSIVNAAQKPTPIKGPKKTLNEKAVIDLSSASVRVFIPADPRVSLTPSYLEESLIPENLGAGVQRAWPFLLSHETSFEAQAALGISKLQITSSPKQLPWIKTPEGEIHPVKTATTLLQDSLKNTDPATKVATILPSALFGASSETLLSQLRRGANRKFGAHYRGELLSRIYATKSPVLLLVELTMSHASIVLIRYHNMEAAFTLINGGLRRQDNTLIHELEKRYSCEHGIKIKDDPGAAATLAAQVILSRMDTQSDSIKTELGDQKIELSADEIANALNHQSRELAFAAARLLRHTGVEDADLLISTRENPWGPPVKTVEKTLEMKASMVIEEPLKILDLASQLETGQ